jgi:Mce-associated membrane protein
MSSETGHEPTPTDPVTEAGETAGSRRGLLALVLGVVVVVLLATTVTLGIRAFERYRDDSARTDAVRAARQTVLNFVSISAATIDRDLARISAGATGDFADQFDRGKPRVKTTVVENKVTSVGKVLESAVVSSDRDSAVVLVVADATVTNSSAPKGQLRHFRIQVDLAKVKDAWRVSTLKFVG